MQNFIRRWRALWDPNRYHGWGIEKNYFEGWYFKIVDPQENYVFALIPGIAKGWNGEDHAFIQVLDGKQQKASYHRFPLEAFVPNPDKFEVKLDNNLFSATELHLDLPELSGQLTLSNTHPWPKMLGAPGIMGWYSFVPFMQCYHGVVSVYHQLHGNLSVHGSTASFEGGIGYTEKDWGQSFPSAWIWTQTNHFDVDQPISLMASVANIPWLSSHFIGYIVGFLFNGKLYRFATYTGAKMKATLQDDKVLLAFKDRKHRLEIVAKQAPGAELVSPISGTMTGKVNESMQAVLEVKLFEQDTCIFEGTGKNAGLEVAGQVDKLLTEEWRR